MKIIFYTFSQYTDSDARNSVSQIVQVHKMRVEINTKCESISKIQGQSKLADQNNTLKSSSSGSNRKNILKNPSSLDFKIRTFLFDQSRVDIKLP
jgi:hypothetical protein